MEYKAPSSIDEAVALLADANSAAHILAGGTDLLVQIRAGFIKPPLVVDIKNIEELRTISSTDEGIRIGAAVSGAELGEHDAMKKEWPGVVEAAELIGSTQFKAVHPWVETCVMLPPRLTPSQL